MKNQQSMNVPSAVTPPSATNPSSDQSFLLTHWLGLYEGHLFRNSPHGTYERYSRALSKFYAHFPGKRFTYEFLRCDIETYKAQRLQEGASATTVNIELSILRGFWRWMLEMGADGAMLNPALGVRVRVAKSQAKVAPQDATESSPSTTV
jgi:site-specific recombinase XerD